MEKARSKESHIVREAQQTEGDLGLYVTLQLLRSKDLGF